MNFQKKRPHEALYNRLVDTAKRRGVLVELSYEKFLLFTAQRRCHYCFATITWNGQAYNLDRKDSTESYSAENCVVCCARCNKGKGDWFSYEEWVVMSTALRKYHRLIGRI